MKAGMLDKRVTIQAPSEGAQNEYGEPVEPWADVATVWASVSPLNGKELTFARQRQANVTHEVRMRYRSDLTITPANRLKMGNRVLHIESVRNEAEADVEWVIGAVEQTAGAQ